MYVNNSGTTERLYLGGDAYSAPAVYIKDASTGSWNVYYICRDYLGSITAITNSSGLLVQELSYGAWGRLRDPVTQVAYVPGNEPALLLGRGYTGHEHLTMFGLINMNARLYDPALGRFLSPDPYVQSPDFSQSFNRYSYGLNNPLMYIDPTGATWMSKFGHWLMNGGGTGIYLGASAIVTIIDPPVGMAMFGGYLGGLATNKGQSNFCRWDWQSPDTYCSIIMGAATFGSLGDFLFNPSTGFTLSLGINMPYAKVFAEFANKYGLMTLEGAGLVTLAGGGCYMTYEYMKILLGERPDSDGKVTLPEAKAWSQFGEGTLTVDVNSIDFSGVSISDFHKGRATVNLESMSPYFRDSGDGMVYGNLTLYLNSDKTGFTVMPDTYNFDVRFQNKKEFWRNIKTIGGALVNAVTLYPMPVIMIGKPFDFKFNGTYYFK